jgi:hypothetical protein
VILYSIGTIFLLTFVSDVAIRKFMVVGKSFNDVLLSKVLEVSFQVIVLLFLTSLL